jgi:hypothetical protein
MPKCGYCGGCHTYSAEMCRDMLLKPGFASITVPMDYESICAAVRARIREGAVERALTKLKDLYPWLEVDNEEAAEVVDAVLGVSNE